MIPLTIARPWIHLPFDAPLRVLSWTLNSPGFVEAPAISWREVRNADLTPELDVRTWLQGELDELGRNTDVCFLTSRDVRAVTERTASVDGTTVRAVATTGLSNAEHIGTRLDRSGKDWGTINVAVICETALADAALIETLAIAAQARTAAVIAQGFNLPTGIATGTGTDCIAVAAHPGDTVYAGMHTALGAATGRAVYDAVHAGAEEWMATVRKTGGE